MKNVIIWVMVFAVIIGAAWITRDKPQYIAGRMYIRERGIAASLYTEEEDVLDGMSVLWNGGKATTDADLSSVQVGDVAHLYTVEGEHFVLECIDIWHGKGWLEQPEGDVIVINGWLVCRFTRL